MGENSVEYGKYQPERRHDVATPYLNSMQQAMNTDPQQRFILDWIGLVNRKDENWGVFSKKNYDVVYFHLAPTPTECFNVDENGTPYKWYNMLTRTRKLLGDDCPFLMTSIDNEPQHDKVGTPYFENVMKELQVADLVIHVTDKAKNIWGRHITTPIRYLTAPKVYEDWATKWKLEPIPIHRKLSKVAVMYNTFPTSGLDTQLKAVKASGYKGTVFTGWFWNSGLLRTMWLIYQKFGEFEFPFARTIYETLRNFEGQGDMKPFYNYKIPYVFELYDWLDICKRLERKEYYKLLRWHKVGIQDNYIGASRFVSECAIFNIPVITGDTITAGKCVFPELQTKTRDIPTQAKLIDWMMKNNVENKRIGMDGFISYQEHYGLDIYCEKLHRMLTELGVKGREIVHPIRESSLNTELKTWYEGLGDAKDDDKSFRGGGTEIPKI